MQRRILAALLAALLCFLVPGQGAYAARESAILEVFRPLLPTGELGEGIRSFLQEMEKVLPGEERYSAGLAAEGGTWQVLTLSLETEGQALPLFRIRFSQERGELRLPDNYIREALEDKTFLAALAQLRALGVAAEVDWYGQRLTTGGLLSLLVQTYEALNGQAIVTSDLTLGQELPEMAQKALAIGLLRQDDGWHPEQQPTFAERADALLCWSKAAADGIAHKGAQSVPCEEAEQGLALVAGLLSDFSVTVEEQPQHILTREAYARMTVPVFLEHFGAGLALENLWLPAYGDTEDPVLRQAGALMLLEPNFPSEADGLDFSPEQEITTLEFFDALRQLVTLTGVERDSVLWGEWLADFSPILESVQRLCSVPEESRRLDNDRPYDWYLRQEETGPYSIDNCMPAATAMILRWVYPENQATVEEMRGLAPMDGEGWYPEQVSDILERERVEFETPYIALEDMLAALDAGHILLALLNEGAFGHCVIIKGYERQGAGLWFLTHDPASPERDVYGRWVGEDRRMEAGALLRAMKNHWWQYFDIVGGAID